MGHDMEAHPESNFRVPAITSALEKLELTPKHRGSAIIELLNYKSATVDDIATVHSKSYVSGLEKVMDLASRDGLIFLEGDTCATSTVRSVLTFYNLQFAILSVLFISTLIDI
ncbi:hypothetical protein C5167_034081 [Papaver somniferum]|uniref:Uncharacterized protein n=1 Tax=Papaver somniferum TaxID=3469 RepID=A0A4Y7KDK2_PAPSO|nr:hypothetical protein C5167_034081 [Papaver somniferum]